MTIQEKALEIAQTQIGVQEAPGHKNTGKDVEKYLASVGLSPGFSWCMAFVYWCHIQACEAMGRKVLMFRTGGVLEQARQGKEKYGHATPKPGDVFIMDYGKGQGHTGIVEKVNADGTVSTIEGNTNDDGSREGYEVCRRVRSCLKIKIFLRYE